MLRTFEMTIPGGNKPRPFVQQLAPRTGSVGREMTTPIPIPTPIPGYENQPLVRRQIRTSINMIGTSISTPTTVASAAPDDRP